ncbi:hypothetical protein PHLCEN_2v9138 [Hermanssonia centrifuga]|uniref:Uncharacterized protein n=1 Tax=Hermanssonia centrifuga TaxID=98765 RepID=A0A2R6NRQ7_9APHY|nr:hypothetical protein PHLCEN_2v9138 [Hermanssonia centrifuga]
MFINTLRIPLRTTPLVFRRNLSSAPNRLLNPCLTAKPSTSISLHYPRQTQIIVRSIASQVSGRPGSQTVEHAATNIKEELSNSSADLAKSIAGGNYFSDAVEPTQQTFLGITNSVAHSVPRPYIVFGLAGGLPYLGTALTTIYLARQAGEAATGVLSMDPGVAITILHQALSIQTTYGAVLLSFLGALHWGFEFAGYGGNKGYPRLLLGAAPVVYGWSTLALDPINALIAQWVGFTALWFADMKASGQGWTPKWYSQYRFYLSVLVGTCIIGSLAATSYWGPVGGHGIVSHDLKMIRAERKSMQPDNKGRVGGEIEAVPAPAEADAYVVVQKKKHEEKKGKKDTEKDAGATDKDEGSH